MRITIVTAVPKDESSGGISSRAIGLKAGFEGLAEVELFYVHWPKKGVIQVIGSILRRLGIRTPYDYFSSSRLNAVGREIASHVTQSEPDGIIFVGITHFVKYTGNLPYWIYQDCVFPTYVETYNQKDKHLFFRRSLLKIFELESNFVKGSQRLFLTSFWAIESAIAHGYLNSKINFLAAAGDFEAHVRDVPVNQFELLFVSTDFEGKGGKVVLEAFSILKPKFPNLSLTIIGECPPIDVPGIVRLGFLNKNIPEEKYLLTSVYSRCGLLILPSRRDTTSILIKELRTYGCPVVCSNWNALPEQVSVGKTGFIWNMEDGVHGFVAEVEKILGMDSESYMAFRQGVIHAASGDPTYRQIASELYSHVSK